MIFNHDGPRRRRRPEGTRADLPAGRLGRAQRDRDLGQHPRGRRAARSPRPTSAPRTSPPSASPTSARRRWCGTGPPASRSTTRSSGRTPAPTPSASSSASSAAAPSGTRPRSACRWPPTSRARRSAGSSTTSTAPGRRPRPATWCSATWTPGCIWNMTGGVDGGLHITDPTNASRTMLMDLDTLSLGRGHRGRDGHPAVHAAGDPLVAREVYGEVRERGSLHGVPIAGDLGDQQAATFGQACLSVGRGQEHLRHRQLHADQHRHAEGAVQERPAHHGLLQDR